MTKLKALFFRHRYFFSIFGGQLLYQWIVAGVFSVWRVNGSFLQYYALDYGMGFASYILPSALYRAAFGDPDTGKLTVLYTALMILLFAVLALFLERLIATTPAEYRRAACVLVFLFLTGPFTFAPFVQTLGIPETLWLWLAVLFFICLSRKELYLLCAPLCAAVLLVNQAGLLCFVPVFCLLLLYRLSQEETKSGKTLLTAAFILSVTVSLALGAYLALFGKNNMAYTIDEFNTILRARGADDVYYIDSLLYERYESAFPEEAFALMLRSPFYTPGESLTKAQEFVNLLLIRLCTIRVHWRHNDALHYAAPLLAALPVTALFFRFCFSEIRDRGNKPLRRFVFLCAAALAPVSLCVSLTMSIDVVKWITFLFLPLFAFILYVFFREPEKTALRLRRFTACVEAAHIPLYCAVYALCVYSMYD